MYEYFLNLIKITSVNDFSWLDFISTNFIYCDNQGSKICKIKYNYIFFLKYSNDLWITDLNQTNISSSLLIIINKQIK